MKADQFQRLSNFSHITITTTFIILSPYHLFSISLVPAIVEEEGGQKWHPKVVVWAETVQVVEAYAESKHNRYPKPCILSLVFTLLLKGHDLSLHTNKGMRTSYDSTTHPRWLNIYIDACVRSSHRLLPQELWESDARMALLVRLWQISELRGTAVMTPISHVPQ